MGRDLTNSHNKPRIIDLDILFAENLIIDSPELIVPQADLEKRAYVLLPLLEITPQFTHPLLKLTIRELALKLNNSGEGVKYRDKVILE
jgi:2-amino-4-hydroxy-6-hydroxymethyldihydropteridine diphosphokinase